MRSSEIDDLLTAMFRNGKLNMKAKIPTGKPAAPGKAEEEEPGVPALEWDPAGDAAKADQALEAVKKAQEKMAGALQADIEKLAKEAQANMAELEERLEQDGVTASNAGNGGNPKDLESAFEKARQEAGQQVLGQDPFLDALTVAFKRPFVAGTSDAEPLCRAAVLGKAGTGRHSALTALTESLGRQGVLKSPRLAFLDLGRYSEAGTEKLFQQDLFSALKGGASGLVFENFQECHPSVQVLVSALFKEGEAPLSGRYAEQKGMLVDIGSALVAGTVSSLSGAGKYLFLLTDKNESKIADAFGMPFLSALDDICETGPFAKEALEQIAEKELEKLCKLAEKQLRFTLTYEKSAAEALAGAFAPDRGVNAMKAASDDLYKAMSEAKLKQGLDSFTGVIVGEDGVLLARETRQEGEGLVLKAGEDAGDSAREEAIAAVKAQMNEIVGLREIKEYILSLEDNFKIQQLRREKGLKAESPSMHMIFTGNPGTGKTTVARIVSRYLKAIGVLTGGQLIEVTRADLVGQYVGHTAPLTARAIDSALGGVLFIDEAYSLFRGRDDSFGLEAIDTLVKGMEDHRDDLVVILAGYSREMEEFLTANSGLKSRFPNIIEFPDYTAEELLAIAESIVKSKGYRMDKACRQPLLTYFDRAQKQGDPRTNGNGRMARNKVEEAILNCSRRNVKAPEEERDLELLLPEDFELE